MIISNTRIFILDYMKYMDIHLANINLKNDMPAAVLSRSGDRLGPGSPIRQLDKQ